MMVQRLLTFAFALLLILPLVAQPHANGGILVEYKNFPSQYVTPRDVWVWLPHRYEKGEKYDVLYMHDGQMLFDSTTTWNHQEWQVDENMSRLIKEGKTRPCIVVAIANIPETRYGDYFPRKTLDYLPAGKAVSPDIKFNADNYLHFIVAELKPYIDSHYSTRKGRNHTFIMGSSMGGLISLYALCEYPAVFGGAACLSTHVPMVLSSTLPNREADEWAAAFRSYLNDHLPAAKGHLLYMDRGDSTLDRYYPPYQTAIDSVVRSRGWNEKHFVTRIFPGHSHAENDWARRLSYPLKFLLKRE